MWLVLTAVAGLAAPTPAETEAALTKVNGRSPPVGYVFFLDTSQSMEVSSEALRTEIAALVETIPEGDTVEIIAFHVRPFIAMEPTRVTAANRVQLADTIRKVDLPAGYDRDLGAGLDLLADELSARNAPEFVHVFGVSNFCHSPTMLSQWSSGARGCGPVRNQAAIGKKLTKRRAADRLSVHWFPVHGTSDSVDATGIAAAMAEIGGERVTDDPATWLQNYRARLVSERARPVALADAAAPAFTVEAGAATAEGTVTLTLHNTARVLDLELDALELVGATTTSTAPLLLDPIATLPVSLTVPAPPWSLFPREDDVSVEVTLRAKGRLGPAPALSLWGMNATHRGMEATVTVPVHRSYGLSGLAAAAVLAGVFAVSGFTAVWVRGKLMPVRLGGTLYARHKGGPRQPLNIADAATASIVLTPEGAARLGKVDEASVVLRARRPLWTLQAQVDIRTDDVEINGQPAKRGVHRVVPGATSLRVGDWRLAWE